MFGCWSLSFLYLGRVLFGQAASAGCGHPLASDIVPGRTIPGRYVAVNDPYHPRGYRRYTIFLPSYYDPNTALPLVLDFHGFYDDAFSEAKEDGVNMAAEREGFMVVYPRGLADNPLDPNDWWNQWNGGGSNATVSGRYGKRTCTSDHSPYPCYTSCVLAGVCKPGQRRDDCGCSGCSDDLGFIVSLLKHLKSKFCVDESRIHGTGMSNGAIFLYYLATTREVGSQLASIVPVEGSFLLGFLDAPKVPMPLLDVHGTKDDCVPANVSNSWGPYKRRGCPVHAAGKQGCAVGDDGFFYTPQAEILQTWSAVNTCSETGALALQTPWDGLTGWSCMLPKGNCEASVQVCTHDLAHTWPFHAGHPKHRTRQFGEMMWWFMKGKRRRRADAAVVVWA